MPRYIDAEKLCEFARNHTNKSVDCNDIMRFPLADVQEVRRGHWIKFKIQDDVYEHMKCSNCSFYWSMPQHSNIFLHCPHCGASMGEEE